MLNKNNLCSTSPSYLLMRLIEQYKNQKQIIVAYDFDDTVKPFYCSSCDKVVSAIKMAKKYLNAYLIVYTCNNDISRVTKYLDDQKIPYDAVNTNAPFIEGVNGKIFYNLFLEDKAGLGEAVSVLEDLCHLVINNAI